MIISKYWSKSLTARKIPFNVTGGRVFVQRVDVICAPFDYTTEKVHLNILGSTFPMNIKKSLWSANASCKIVLVYILNKNKDEIAHCEMPALTRVILFRDNIIFIISDV